MTPVCHPDACLTPGSRLRLPTLLGVTPQAVWEVRKLGPPRPPPVFTHRSEERVGGSVND